MSPSNHSSFLWRRYPIWNGSKPWVAMACSRTMAEALPMQGLLAAILPPLPAQVLPTLRVGRVRQPRPLALCLPPFSPCRPLIRCPWTVRADVAAHEH